MLDLSKLPVQVTLGALSRYSAARVHPYTALVGEVLCYNFQLTAQGRKNIEVAVTSLQVVGSVGDALEFGFGIEDVVRSMAKSERGCICLALCAALKDCYSDDMAVEVLLEMARLVKVDGQYMPSSHSWKDLLSACAGVLSTSKFPVLAERLMQLPAGEERLGAYQRLEGLPARLRKCSSPKSIAEALLALSRVSRGELHSITLIGNADVGWLAAIADWLLGLGVIMKKNNGEMFYTNCIEEMAQVHIIITDQADKSTGSVQTVGKTYRLDDVSKLFDEEGRATAAVVSGRIEWKSLFRSTFLSDFDRLMEISQTLGDCIGSAARLFKGLANAEEDFHPRYRLACTSYCDASFGAGFIANTLQWFPELEKLRQRMQKAVQTNLATARRDYEACISLIRSHCGCHTCQSDSTGHDLKPDDDDEEMTPAPESGDEDDSEFSNYDDWDPDRFCEVVIVETIICLSRALSNVVLQNQSLVPVRSGLEIIYGRQFNQRRSANSGRKALVALGPIAFCLDFDSNFSFGVQVGNNEGVELRLNTILELFSGRSPLSMEANYSAVCSNGICAFLGILKEPSEDRGAVAQVYVLPGRISHEGKSYTKLIDRIQPANASIDLDSSLKAIEHIGSDWATSLNVRESSNALECLLEITLDKSEDHYPISIGPCHLAILLASKRGLITCKFSRRPCSNHTPFTKEEIKTAIQNKGPLQVREKSISFFESTDTATMIGTLASMAYIHEQFSIYVVEKECNNCCIRAALAVDHPDRTHFCFLRLPIT